MHEFTGKIQVTLYCFHCMYYYQVGTYERYAVNLAAFQDKKCPHCHRIEWRLDVKAEKIPKMPYVLMDP